MFVTVDILFTGIMFSHCVDDFYSQHFEKIQMYEGWNFNSGNYLFTTDTK